MPVFYIPCIFDIRKILTRYSWLKSEAVTLELLLAGIVFIILLLLLLLFNTSLF